MKNIAELALNTLRASTYFGRVAEIGDSNQRGRVLAQHTIRKGLSPNLDNQGEVIGYLEYALEQLQKNVKTTTNS